MLSESKKPDDLVRLKKIKSNIEFRSRYLNELRSYFVTHNFVEIETPVMVQSPAPEDYINAPQVGDFFLRTSPELHMKRLIASGFKKIFQIGPCFREGEKGKLHNVEFSMLEWYEVGKDYNYLLNFIQKLLIATVKNTIGSTTISFNGTDIDLTQWKSYTVRDAFREFANTTPEQTIKEGSFEIILTEKIEPNLPKDRPVILKDYPASMAALSKLKEDDKTLAERWELYLGGIEIANAYSELTDPTEQITRFKLVNNNRKDLNLPEYPDDIDYLKALEYGMSPYTGIALGIDRLIMVLTDSANIREVIAFTEHK